MHWRSSRLCSYAQGRRRGRVGWQSSCRTQLSQRGDGTIDQTRYSADPTLAQPGRFLRAACRDIVASERPARLFALTALRARHRRTWLGYAWLLVPALVTAAACTALRHNAVIAIRETPFPYPLFAFAGMLLWQGFVEAIFMPGTQILSNRHLLTRTSIPHEAVLLAGLYDLATNAVVRLVILFVLLPLFGVPILAQWLLVPLGAALLILFGVAIGLLLSPLSLLYDDIGRVIGVVTSFGLLLTPVLYPLPAQSVLWLNPVATLLAGTRGWIVGAMPGPGYVAIGAAGIVGVIVGWLSYRVARPRLVERLG